MSFAANPNKPKKTLAEAEAAAAARQQKVERERIRRLIITLGDEKKKVAGQIRGLAGALEDDVELHGDLITATILECATNLPLKTSILAALVARMVEKHAHFASSLVVRAQNDLQAALRAGQVTNAQLLLRFLVELGNTGTVGLSSIIVLLQEVLALADGLRPNKGGDMGVFLMLASLPFISLTAYKMVSDGIENLIAAANTYLATRDARWKSLFRVLKSDEPPDRLEALASMLRSLKQAEWSSMSIFHVPGFNSCLEEQLDRLKLSPLEVTADEIRKSKFRLQVPSVATSLVTKQLEKDSTDDRIAEHDRWILEDHILITIEKFGSDVDECSKQLLKIPVLHPHFEAITIEIIFSQLLQLPSPPLLPLFYSRLLESLVEKQHSMTKFIDKAYAELFRQIQDLDEECLEVLAEAFAYHLMHNGYQADWSPFTGDGVTVYAQRFVRRTFERLQRLSFHQNLVHKLPAAVHMYIPPEPVAATVHSVQDKPEFTQMLNFVRIKESNERNVLQYCYKLLKMQPKEEQKEEDTSAGTGAQVVSSFEHGSAAKLDASTELPSDEKAKDDINLHRKREEFECGHEGEDDAIKSPKTKSRRLDDACTGTEQESASTGTDKSANCSPDAPMAEELAQGNQSRNNRDILRVKEEVKHEDEQGNKLTGADSVTKPPTAMEGVGIAKHDEDSDEDTNEPWSLELVTELLIVAVLQNGAKTPTHMTKMLDGHQQIFMKLRPLDDEEAHNFSKTIVRCNFEFWRISGQRLEITLDMLMHRGIVTSRSIVEHALANRGPQACDSMSVWNMINSVARKSLECSQSMRVELAVAKKLGKTDIVSKSRQQLEAAIHETAELFTLIFTGLVRNHQDFEDNDTLFRHITLQRVLTIGRKYHAFIKPLIETAESRIPGVAHNPEISAIFQSLRTL